MGQEAMGFGLSMLYLIAIWAALLVALVVFATGRPGKGGALTLAYFLGLSLIYVPGVLPFLGSGVGLSDRDQTQLGFEMTILGMAAFVAGAVLARCIDRRRAAAKGAPPRRRAQAFNRLGWRALALGVVAYFMMLPLSFKVPSLTSIVAPLATLLILGLWLALYGAAVAADRRRMLAIFALLPLLPLATLVTGGFLGFGVYWVLSILAFFFVITRRRIWFYITALPLAFLGLSLFVTYMGQRVGIREVVWHEQAGLFDRLDRASSIITKFELLDLTSHAQIAALNDRLNQNAFVGMAVMRHNSGWSDFAYGATVPLWALIPRAVWPGKPAVGGSGNIVSDFTGIRFAAGTSIGVGQVFEFYVNFGVPGVMIGFLSLGYLLMWLDQGIMRALAADDMRGLLLRAMPGLMLLQPGGSLLEIIVGCVAAYIAAHLVVWLKFLAIPSTVRPSRQMAGLRRP
ncbi:MAG TPA: hypothetical protein VJ770_08665 [Stellaceae bacterium]|nr:hypothetical protein [Stellaceae bacterium]